MSHCYLFKHKVEVFMNRNVKQEQRHKWGCHWVLASGRRAPPAAAAKVSQSGSEGLTDQTPSHLQSHLPKRDSRFHLVIGGSKPYRGLSGGEVEKSWIASSTLAVSNVLRSRKGGLVCKACQWFVWFVAGFSSGLNNDRWDTLSSEASSSGPQARATWPDSLKPTPAHVFFSALNWRVLRLILGIFWNNSLHVIQIGQSPDGQTCKFRVNHKLLSFWNETASISRPGGEVSCLLPSHWLVVRFPNPPYIRLSLDLLNPRLPTATHVHQTCCSRPQGFLLAQTLPFCWIAQK